MVRIYLAYWGNVNDIYYSQEHVCMIFNPVKNSVGSLDISSIDSIYKKSILAGFLKLLGEGGGGLELKQEFLQG